MDLNKLRIFHHVALYGGVKKSSATLKIRASSISIAIASLESSMGYKLFSRHHQGMVLTEKGKDLFQLTQKIFDEISRFEASELSKKDNDSITGDLVISTSQGVASSKWFNNRIVIFLSEFQNIRVKVVEFKAGCINDIKADIFICPYIKNNNNYIQRKVNDFVFKLYANQSYIKKYGLPKTFEELDNHRLVSFTQESLSPYDDVDSLLHQGREIHNPRSVYLQTNSSESLLTIVNNGGGIAALWEQDGIENDLVPVCGQAAAICKETYIVFHKEKKEEPIIKLFLERFTKIDLD